MKYHTTLQLPLGPVMGDVVGLELTDEDLTRLAHPLMGGVTLFARNYADPAQLKRLTAGIRAIRSPHLLIAVDHEGGRVQRFRDGFTSIPPMRAFGQAFDTDAGRGVDLAASAGYVIGVELGGHGVDFPFAPVLDLDWGESGVIGNRAFHADAAIVTTLARALAQGLRDAGMASVGKHYPGHGFVRADSHHQVPIDERSLIEIQRDDLQPFAALCAHNEITGIMPAHVIYPQVDSKAAGFSSIWLKDRLRHEFGFNGVIFSDDLTMEGASVAGGDVERGVAALEAGCDLVLLCNDPARCDGLLNGLAARGYTATRERSAHFERMQVRPGDVSLASDARYRRARTAVLSMV